MKALNGTSGIKLIATMFSAVFMMVLAASATAAETGEEEVGRPPHPHSILIKDGVAQADILISPAADDMEMHAAQELQQTLKMVSGATLPIYRADTEPNSVSAYLQQDQLNIQKSGAYPVSFDFLNNHGRSTVVEVVYSAGNAFPIRLNDPIELQKDQAGSITGTLYVPPSTADGTYELSFEARSDGQSIGSMELEVTLNRNTLLNGGFEESVKEGWYSTTAAQDSEVSHSGSSSLRLASNNVRSNQPLRLERGKQYKLKAWVKGAKNGTARMQVNEMGSPYNVKHSVVSSFSVTTDWTEVELIYHADEHRPYDYHWLVFSFLQGNGPGTLWIDDVTLAEVEEEGPSEPPGPPPVVDYGPAHNRVQLVLSTTDRIPSNQDTAYLANSDGFAVRQKGSRIYILGSEARGILNGVYDFLEENAGVLWTRSKELGTLYDPLPTVTATRTNYAEKSPIPLRGWLTLGMGENGDGGSDQATDVMLARNKNNIKMSDSSNRLLWDRFARTGLTPVMLGHNLAFWLPNDEYFAEHPDYYNMKDGKYIPLSDSTQINFYHPEVPGVIAAKAKKLIASRNIDYIGIGINDNSSFDQGELSRQPFTTEDGVVVQPEDPAYRSTVFFSFLNNVAREIHADYPDVKIVSYAYTFTDTPPKVDLEDNIVLVYAPLYEDAREPLNTSNTSNPNYAYNEKLRGWAEKTKNILVYNYYGSFPSDAYERPIAAKVQADLQYYRELGILGVLPEGTVDAGNDAWGINALQYWLFNKLFWNPDEDIEVLKTQFINKAYGAAAEPMRRYYDLIEQGWNYDRSQQSWATSGESLVRQYVIVAGIRDQAQQALDEAYALADGKAKARIEPIKTTFERMVEIAEDSVNISANAVRTTTSKDQILSTLDFGAGPWRAVESPVTYFKDMSSGKLPPVLTKVYLLWDEEYIYIGYENFDPDPSKMVISDTAPNEWWLSGKDDSVETYLMDGTPGSSSYYAFMTNALPLNLDYKGPEKSPDWTRPWESRAEVKFDRWNVIQAIPFSSIQFDPDESRTLTGLFFRNYHRTGSGLGLYGWAGGAVWNPADFRPIHLID